MRADNDLRLARRDPLHYRVPLLAFDAAGQHFDLQADRLAKPADRCKMLAGQDFGWRHQHRLSTGLHRVRHGHQRNKSLAGAHVALHQPQHALILGNVGANFRYCSLLTSGQRKGQGRLDSGADPAFDADGPTGNFS